MEESKLVFEKLTPVTNSDIKNYESAIDYVFKENDVRNVAISGAYGSGKSSVLESYKKKHTTDEDKASIFTKIVPKLNENKAAEYLTKMHFNEFIKVFDMRLRPRFVCNNTSNSILEAFKEKGWISEYLEDSEKPGYYRIRRAQPKKNDGKVLVSSSAT